MDEFADKFDKMINELNEPNLPRTSLTVDRGKWTTKLVTIAKRADTSGRTSGLRTDEFEPLLNNRSSTVTLTTDDSVSYIIASNQETVEFETPEGVNGSINLKVNMADEGKRQLTLGFTQKAKPDILITQNPANGYGPTEAVVKEWNYRFIFKKSGGAILFISSPI